MIFSPELPGYSSLELVELRYHCEMRLLQQGSKPVHTCAPGTGTILSVRQRLKILIGLEE